MSNYPIIGNRRRPYDIDGTAVGYRVVSSTFSEEVVMSLGIEHWANAALKQGLNNELNTQVLASGSSGAWQSINNITLYFMFPEKINVTHVGYLFPDFGDLPQSPTIQGSANSTNSIDGDWETASGMLEVSHRVDWWRVIQPVTLSTSISALKVNFRSLSNVANSRLASFHIYGKKATGQTLDDILILDNTVGGTPEFLTVNDFGERPEGTQEIRSMRLENASSTKTANSVEITMDHADFAIAWDVGGPWASVLSIASLNPGAVSSPIYIRNLLPPPLIPLGPKAAPAIVTVDNWTT